ncbi:hypothetical protein A2276_05350 [candidate division WOR-1 bacterium RIFOXYA12_FULL_43_27]|uniref:DUF86 domain-containing protein n=1 Tax=candidate division WOR-1 bacterium RIFOXYC2_FULL_46_14 TaxID=1802587 RepID=A0A1F4U3T1_UNCSA|nr:MAG: hypothetical protein A2276_05350 [candidate division WOR-1 bacterium RIFOXYA12_FULL_43_27]OGC20092.1 MAG: hypothetical protein A2292_03355 [candidate division WOR-1 bacterium RIFOXYB2_FULL_46_45]OGC32172.1 MAG: hypothetical protein A2232_08095 [candidate division WOR-1 bacterium RIFOXYA2_FULL_46_56]OGC39572.1 MAG: hypothetical protein A2438_08460 [candidate division WOR-1 bacterium RIFOXYC2_FULL_46_14]
MKDDGVFLRHILDEIDYLLKRTKTLTFDQLMDDETLKRALSRSLEIIGEASKNLSDKFKNNHPEVEWKKIAGLRDKLIHSYFGVDWYTVWDVVRIKIPELKNQLEKLKHG